MDHHVYGRLGRFYVKLYAQERGLNVTILVDASHSMACGEPEKFDFARRLAAALGYIALNSGDQVSLAAFSLAGVEWLRRLRGVSQAARMVDWLASRRPSGTTDMGKSLNEAAAAMAGPGMTFILSDWIGPGAERGINGLRTRGQEIAAIQVLADDELDPRRHGSGPVRFIDAEDGRSVEVAVTDELLKRYASHLENWRSELRAHILAASGAFLSLSSTENLKDLIVRLCTAGERWLVPQRAGPPYGSTKTATSSSHPR